MHTSVYAHPNTEDLERASVHRHEISSNVDLSGVTLIVKWGDVPLLAATLHRLADELTAAQPETVYSEAQAAVTA